MIDCLFIGHNEMQFDKYEEMVRTMGRNSGAYRDLNLNFIQFQAKRYTASEVYNHFGASSSKYFEPMNLGNKFSLAIAYLGSYLVKRGFSIDYVNSFQNQKEELAEKLAHGNIRLIAIPTTLYVSVFPILEIMTFIKKYNREASVIIGGPFIATQIRTQEKEAVQYMMKSIGADFYVNSSQGEGALAETLGALRDGKPFKGIRNLIYRDGGEYLTNTFEPEYNSLDENNIDWRLFDHGIQKIIATRTAISCPFSCAFCGFPQHAGKYQTAAIETVEQELNLIEGLGKVVNIHFIDDTFNIPPERYKEMLRMMIRNRYSFKWNCNFRCQFTDREMVELMKESGCEGVFLGFESGSPQILKNMNKAATVEKYREGMDLLKEYDITTYGSFIIGFPGETYETVNETIDFIETCKPTFFRTQLWYCDPFTPIWKEKDRYQIKNSQFEWSHAMMDYRTACDLIDEIFLSVKNSIWVPQYNFEFDGIFNLLHRGMDLSRIKAFLTAFNRGIKEKLLDPSQKDVSSDVWVDLGNACKG